MLQQKLGPGYTVIAEGLNGRTTVHDDPMDGGPVKNGHRFLPVILETHAPIDLVIIKLGTNDLKARFNKSAWEIAQGMGVLVDLVKTSGCGRNEGMPRVLVISPPPTLDPHFSTSISTRNIAMHIFEQLVTRDENNDVIPELAEGWQVSPDGLVYTFKIRSGVKFHNGKELTSADVKASFERYKRMALAKVTLAPVQAIEALVH